MSNLGGKTWLDERDKNCFGKIMDPTPYCKADELITSLLSWMQQKGTLQTGKIVLKRQIHFNISQCEAMHIESEGNPNFLWWKLSWWWLTMEHLAGLSYTFKSVMGIIGKGIKKRNAFINIGCNRRLRILYAGMFINFKEDTGSPCLTTLIGSEIVKWSTC